MEAASIGATQPPQPGEGDRTPEQSKSSKATPKQNQNAHRAKKNTIGMAHTGTQGKSHYEIAGEESSELQIIRSRAGQQRPAAREVAVRVLEMDNFLTMCPCPHVTGSLG